MAKLMRKIITIDEEKCDGCGLCVDACHEGAIQIVDGKAALVSDFYCDGLGDCIGECPQGAITFETREADPYDEEAVKARLAARAAAEMTSQFRGCPGSAVRNLRGPSSPPVEAPSAAPAKSHLANWPVQITLVPETAPYLRKAHLVIAADCTPFAFADFHRTFLAGENKVCLVGCPKLDDAGAYVEKLTRLIGYNEITDITLVRMEVPCCGGMTRVLEAACERAPKDVALKIFTIGVEGDMVDKETIRFAKRG